jgi:hypothetical protein
VSGVDVVKVRWLGWQAPFKSKSLNCKKHMVLFNITYDIYKYDNGKIGFFSIIRVGQRNFLLGRNPKLGINKTIFSPIEDVHYSWRAHKSSIWGECCVFMRTVNHNTAKQQVQ